MRKLSANIIKYISKIILVFSILLFMLGIIYFISGICDGYLFHGNRQAFEYLLSDVFILVWGVLFLGKYRIIDLLEKNQK